MNVLLIGGGGREHALAWKLSQSPRLTRLIAAPGNPGIARHADIADLNVGDHRAVIDFCRHANIGLVIVGPEAPLVAGLADNLRAIGLAVLGPSAAAAQLEGSKGFTKDLCRRADIPTARYERIRALDGGIAALQDFALPVVVKADGLAAGKGVTIAETREEAEAALTAIFADSGAEAVLEEFLSGEEASLFVLADGETAVVLGSAQDHKRVGDGDTGPNTGGMGAYSPAPVLTPELEEAAMARIVRPTLATMAAEGMPFTGILYAGLMLTTDGPQLIEYNVRFGDPECEVLLPRIESDLLALLDAAARGTLADANPPRLSAQTALTVVVAAEGYPGTPRAGGAIAGIEAAEADGVIVFQAGTRTAGERLVAAGGRVLAVTALGDDIAQARKRAYAAVDRIDYGDGFHRRDIGWRELARQSA